jgi:hypothetical protein
MAAISGYVPERNFVSKGKDEMRKQLASLSFTEKIKILEKLRDRSLAIAASGLRVKRAAEQTSHTKETIANQRKED